MRCVGVGAVLIRAACSYAPEVSMTDCYSVRHFMTVDGQHRYVFVFCFRSLVDVVFALEPIQFRFRNLEFQNSKNERTNFDARYIKVITCQHRSMMAG